MHLYIYDTPEIFEVIFTKKSISKDFQFRLCATAVPERKTWKKWRTKSGQLQVNPHVFSQKTILVLKACVLSWFPWLMIQDNEDWRNQEIIKIILRSDSNGIVSFNIWCILIVPSCLKAILKQLCFIKNVYSWIENSWLNHMNTGIIQLRQTNHSLTKRANWS